MTDRAPSEEASLLQAQALTLSKSKLGVYVMGNSLGARLIIGSGPRVILVFDPHRLPGVLQLARSYKQAFPDGKIAMRVYEGTQGLYYSTTTDPEASAGDFWQRALLPAVMALAPADRELMDYLIGPNEYSNHPPIEPATAAWTGRFWSRLATLIGEFGFRPLLGEIPVGNFDVGNLRQIMPPLLPALRTIRSYGGAWSYHAYTLQYTTDPNVEIWYSLRYRQMYSYLRENAPDLADMPMLLTEVGVDQTGDPPSSGWKARGTAEQYQNWLMWFDREIQRDSYIRGSTIFQIGDAYWSSFNIEGIAPWLADFLRHVPASATRTPTTLPTTTQMPAQNATSTPSRTPTTTVTSTPVETPTVSSSPTDDSQPSRWRKLFLPLIGK